MLKGFYDLTSGMLTQGRHLDVLSNNMANISTNGFKNDRFVQSTFDEVMWYKTGNKEKEYQELGEQSFITAPSEMVTDYSQGAPEETGMPLDFCISGDGYFQLENEDGERFYTRNGSFSLDNEGYLWLSDKGYVLDVNEERIQLVTDKIYTDDYGGLYMDQEGSMYLGRIGVWGFEDETVLEKDDLGFFTTDEAGERVQPVIYNGYVEGANTDWVQLMTEMIQVQRAYQSAAEAIKIYDEVLTKATTDVGQVV